MNFYSSFRRAKKTNKVSVEIFDIESNSAKKYETRTSRLFSVSDNLRPESMTSMKFNSYSRSTRSAFASRSNSIVGNFDLMTPSDLNYITENSNPVYLSNINSFLKNIPSANQSRTNSTSIPSKVMPEIDL
jgi:hypothetical protein